MTTSKPGVKNQTKPAPKSNTKTGGCCGGNGCGCGCGDEETCECPTGCNC